MSFKAITQLHQIVLGFHTVINTRRVCFTPYCYNEWQTFHKS